MFRIPRDLSSNARGWDLEFLPSKNLSWRQQELTLHKNQHKKHFHYHRVIMLLRGNHLHQPISHRTQWNKFTLSAANKTALEKSMTHTCASLRLVNKHLGRLGKFVGAKLECEATAPPFIHFGSQLLCKAVLLTNKTNGLPLHDFEVFPQPCQKLLTTFSLEALQHFDIK